MAKSVIFRIMNNVMIGKVKIGWLKRVPWAWALAIWKTIVPEPEFDTCSSCLFLVMFSRARLVSARLVNCSRITCFINPPSHAPISHS